MIIDKLAIRNWYKNTENHEEKMMKEISDDLEYYFKVAVYAIRFVEDIKKLLKEDTMIDKECIKDLLYKHNLIFKEVIFTLPEKQ